MGEVLEQPGPQDVGRHLREDAALLAVLALPRRIVVVAAAAVGRADAGVAGVAGLGEVVAARVSHAGEAGRARPRVLAG